MWKVRGHGAVSVSVERRQEKFRVFKVKYGGSCASDMPSIIADPTVKGVDGAIVRARALTEEFPIAALRCSYRSRTLLAIE